MISFEPTENSAARARVLPAHRARADAPDLAPATTSTSTTLPWEWVDYYWSDGRKGAPRQFDRRRPTASCRSASRPRSCAGATRRSTCACRPPRSAARRSRPPAPPSRRSASCARSANRRHPIWGAMAITEPSAGSDAAAIQTTARFDAETDEWVLNGTKIFCTAGEGASQVEGGFVVVWATVDKTRGPRRHQVVRRAGAARRA